MEDGEGEQEVDQRAGGTDTSADPQNTEGGFAIGAGAPEEVPTDDDYVDFSEELAELDADIIEFAGPPVQPEYWDAVARKEIVEFLDFWVNGNDSTVALIAEGIGIDGVPVSEYFTNVLDEDALLSTGPEDYLQLRDGLSAIRNRVENNLADSLLDVPIPNLGGAIKWVGRKLATLGGRRAMTSRIRRSVQERINRRRSKRSRRCQRNGGNPVFIDTGAVSQTDPLFAIIGLFEVSLSSTYQSDIEQTGSLGWGRVSDIDASLERLPNSNLRYRDGAGFYIDFSRPTPNIGQWNAGDHIRFMEIAAGRDRTFMVREEGIIKHFKKQTDTTWVLVGLENKNGARLVYERDNEGLLTAIQTPEGLRLEFTNDTVRGLRLAVDLVGTDGERREVMRYAYDANDNMVLAETRYGNKHEYRYDNQHLRVWFRKNDQYEGTYHFDAEKRCVLEETNGPYNGTRFEYDPERRITRHIPGGDPEKTEILYYAEDGAVFAEAHLSGRFKRTYYDGDGNIASDQDGNGNRTKFKYDIEGNITSIEDPEGRISDFRWTEEGQMEFAIDPTGATWESDFDEYGNLIGTKDALGHQTDIKINDMGQPTGICRHDGFIRFLNYTDNNWLVSVIDFDGLETTLERDSFGRVTQMTQADAARTRYTYQDQVGADFWTPAIVTLDDGTRFETRVITPRREIRQIDGGGRATTYLIDGFGKIDETRDARGGTLKFRYDHAEELTEVENQIGQVWRFEQDAMGRLVREIDFGGSEISYEYDDADRLIASTYPDGTRHLIDLDKSGLMMKETVLTPGEDPLVTTYEYDDRALLKSATNADSTVTYERDDNGQVIAEVINDLRIESTYDCCGRRSQRTIDGDVVVINYDPAGRLSAVQIADHDILKINRDALGHETTRQSGTGFALQQKFNAVGLMLSQSMKSKDPAQRPWIDRQTQWSKSYEPTAITDGRWGETRYDYDPNGQISKTTLGNGVTESFGYDARLNISGTMFSNPAAGQAQAVAARVQTWTGGQDGRVEAAQGPRGEQIQLTYDAKGRVVDKTVTRKGFRPETWRFTWNGLDRLTAAHTPDGAKWTYGYDAFARRLWKQEWRREKALVDGIAHIGWQPKIRHDFLWDGDVIASETISGDGPTRKINWYFEPETFVPLARCEGNALSFVVTDHLGTPREVVSESGDLEWAAEFKTWGALNQVWQPGVERAPTPPEIDYWVNPNTPRSEGSLALEVSEPDPSFCPLRFQGQWADAETGLYYNRFRYYEPNVGTYFSKDPFVIVGRPELYRYTDNPTTQIDSLGLRPRQVGYGLTDLSRRVIAARVAAGDYDATSTNYAAAKICRGGRVIHMVRRNVPGGLHSEEVIAGDLLPGDRILELYTERRPCAGCSSLLTRFLGNPRVTYSFPYSSTGRDLLQQTLDRLR